MCSNDGKIIKYFNNTYSNYCFFRNKMFSPKLNPTKQPHAGKSLEKTNESKQRALHRYSEKRRICSSNFNHTYKVFHSTLYSIVAKTKYYY